MDSTKVLSEILLLILLLSVTEQTLLVRNKRQQLNTTPMFDPNAMTGQVAAQTATANDQAMAEYYNNLAKQEKEYEKQYEGYLKNMAKMYEKYGSFM